MTLFTLKAQAVYFVSRHIGKWKEEERKKEGKEETNCKLSWKEKGRKNEWLTEKGHERR